MLGELREREAAERLPPLRVALAELFRRELDASDACDEWGLFKVRLVERADLGEQEAVREPREVAPDRRFEDAERGERERIELRWRFRREQVGRSVG